MCINFVQFLLIKPNNVWRMSLVYLHQIQIFITFKYVPFYISGLSNAHYKQSVIQQINPFLYLIWILYWVFVLAIYCSCKKFRILIYVLHRNLTKFINTLKSSQISHILNAFNYAKHMNQKRCQNNLAFWSKLVQVLVQRVLRHFIDLFKRGILFA